MRMLWSKKKADQLDLLDGVAEPVTAPSQDDGQPTRSADLATPTVQAPVVAPCDGRPLMVCIDRLNEDPNNPRSEFPEPQIDELADDIRARGILKAIVVHPADAAGRYRLHFGAMRLRAAKRAGLAEVPVVVRDAPADPYAQVAENPEVVKVVVAALPGGGPVRLSGWGTARCRSRGRSVQVMSRQFAKVASADRIDRKRRQSRAEDDLASASVLQRQLEARNQKLGVTDERREWDDMDATDFSRHVVGR